MEIAARSHYYNYYNVKGRYTTSEPEKAGWVKRYEAVEDRIEGNNANTDSEVYNAYVKLETIYYDLGVANRARYKSYAELQNAIAAKYSTAEYRANYSATERSAMYQNELSMSAFGCCGNMNDPRLGGPVYADTDSETKSYNRKCVNNQINNIFTNNGISQMAFASSKFTFFIHPYTYQLTVEGDADQSILSQMEALLNENGNSKELFFHILNSIGSTNIDKYVLAKYRAASMLREYTSLDIRNFIQTKDGLIDENGNNILDIFKKSIKEASKVPAEFKGAAYDVFEEYIKQITATDVNSIDDMYLSIGFENGQLKDMPNSNLINAGFHFAS
ncbi:MAG: DUF4885 domain-containing protein [Clostridium sp.]|nr:DUF4885 domain-containing protein [Clostridium sp.]